jgi:hypothetical protein
MIEIITSFDQRYYELIGKDCVNSWLRHWNPYYKLTCYVEDFALPNNYRIKQIQFDQIQQIRLEQLENKNKCLINQMYFL